MANSDDPDQTASLVEQSDQGLHCPNISSKNLRSRLLVEHGFNNTILESWNM